MKFKTTRKAITENHNGKLLAVGYCDMQYLLANHAPSAYTCGIYGWNFDVYQLDGATICTGYRNMPGRDADELARAYERKAEKIAHSRWPYARKRTETERLLREFIERA